MNFFVKSRSRILAFTFLLGSIASGCVSSEEQRAIDMARDRDNCASLGFPVGSPALADCMASAAASRAADRDREAAANREWQRQREENFRRMQAGNNMGFKPDNNCRSVERVSTKPDGTVVTKREQVCSNF